jgi:hypothetical protein
MIRRIRRWLGIPTQTEIRAMILREIDADAVWQNPAPGEAYGHQRETREIYRRTAIAFGKREDTRG